LDRTLTLSKEEKKEKKREKNSSLQTYMPWMKLERERTKKMAKHGRILTADEELLE